MRIAKAKEIWTEAEKAAWRLPEKMTISQHADANRILDEKTCPEDGAKQNDKTPE